MPGPTWRIVVADDHADTRDLYAEVLSLMQFGVVTAANGEDALALCLAERPHALVADLRMPKMNGYELLEALRRHDETRGLPAIATSASVDEEQRALSHGFEAFCAKPCDPQRLTLSVVAVLLKHAVAEKRDGPDELPVQVRASSDGLWWGVWHGPQLVSRWTSEFSARDAARVFSDTRDVPLDLVPFPGRRGTRGA
jgi:CheY-like chemotaxis protein